jgi:hypothetical protein
MVSRLCSPNLKQTSARSWLVEEEEEERRRMMMMEEINVMGLE